MNEPKRNRAICGPLRARLSVSYLTSSRQLATPYRVLPREARPGIFAPPNPTRR